MHQWFNGATNSRVKRVQRSFALGATSAMVAKNGADTLEHRRILLKLQCVYRKYQIGRTATRRECPERLATHKWGGISKRKLPHDRQRLWYESPLAVLELPEFERTSVGVLRLQTGED
jgi:hypothetical protein